MNDMLDRVKKFIIDGNLISKGDIVGCALSGGSDSVFMTLVLNEISKGMGFKVMGIHVNHMLRGKNSHNDESFVNKFCENIGIECRVYREDVKSYSINKKISVEMAGREVRYKIFEDLKKRSIITKCSLGHHVDDDVETIVMRIFRGTGLKGIEGISIIRDNFYIRPILFLRKYSEIERFLNDNNIKFILDYSNFSHDYLRNKIRMSIIPYINGKLSMDVTNNILRLKEICKCDNEFFDTLVKKYVKKYVRVYENRITLNKRSFALHHALLYRIIRHIVVLLNGEIHNIEFKSMKYICSVVNKKIGKVVQIKKNLFCTNEKGYVSFSKEILDKKGVCQFYYEELLNSKDVHDIKTGIRSVFTKEVFFIDNKLKVTITLEKDIEKLDFRNVNFKYFSLDEVDVGISLRNRRYGDVFKPFGMENEKKLKQIFINEKIKNKDKVPLICFDDNIAWVVGIRNSDRYKVSANSKCVIRIELNYL